METPLTPAGGMVLACDMDEACPTLDCDADMDGYTHAILETPDGAELLAHYCGLDFVGKLSAREDEK